MIGKTVLVVEDNEMNLKLVRALLQKGAFHVLEAQNAEKGIQIAHDQKPDLILMDIQLPGMDGLSATRILKQDPSLKKTPIAALTSYAMEGDFEKAKEAGCDGYIAKPIDTRSFIATIHKILNSAPDADFQPCAEAYYRKRILIIDDEPLNVKLLEAQIPRDQYEVIRAYNGIEGLEKVARNSPDLILLDVMMPGMDGYEVTRRIKNDPEGKHIPVILITALGEIEDKIKGLEAGADEFLNKPVQKIELLSRIHSLILYKQLQEQFITRTQADAVLKGSITETEFWKESPPKKRVWVVEDNPQDVKLIRHYLGGCPCELEFIANGNEALVRLEKDPPDLVLLDILLPGIDGFEICRHLKSRDRTRNTQVLLITCLSDLENRAKGFKLGADDLLAKPVNGYELKLRVNTLLQKKTYLDRLNALYEADLYEGVTDWATGLYNRAYLRHFLSFEIKRSLRQKYPISLLMCAIHDFPGLVRLSGREAGERILREFSHLLKDNFREVDLLFHLGEEIFSVVLPYTDGAGAIKGGERLIQTLGDHSFLAASSRTPVQIQIRLGIATHSSPDLGVDQFLQKADDALYQARMEGKNLVCLEEKPSFL